MVKRNLIIILLLGSVAAGMAQVSKRDSLLKLLPAAKEDTAAVLLYLTIGDQYENSSPETARQYYRRAANLSQQLKFDAGYYKCLTYFASTFLVEGNYDSIMYYHEKALALAREMKDSLNIGISLFNIGIAYSEQSDFAKAIDYCLQGRTILEQKGHKRIEVQVNDALQNLYNSRVEYSRAIVFGEKAVAQARELNMELKLATCLINLSRSYISLNLDDKAEAAVKEALKITHTLQDPRLEAAGVSNLAGLALKNRDYAQTRSYTERSLALYRQIGSIDGEATALRAMAVCYLQEGKLALAKEYAEKALQVDRQNNFKREESSALRVLSCIAYASGDLPAGIEYDDQSNNILETMVRDVLSQQSSDLEKKYETEKKESRIKQLEAEQKVQQLTISRKNILNVILIGSALALLLISLLLYFNYRQKQRLQQQRINELETEKQLAATEAVLKGEEQERTRLAKDLHDGLGGMLSGIKYSFQTMKGNLIMTPDNQQAFERSMDMLDSSIKEMRRVAHNMMPEALVKFGLDIALKDFCNDINQSGALSITYQSIGLADVDIEQTMAITIYRIVQELINNTLKHAGAKTAIVQVTKTGGQLAITIEDDGKGFNTAILQAAKGIGWTNIQSRVDFLKGKLDVQSAPGKGTSVHIELNNA